MIPRILNLQARPLRSDERSEPCEPDVRYFPVGDNVVAFDANTLVAVEISKAQHEALTAPREAPAASRDCTLAQDADYRIRTDHSSLRLLFSGVQPKFELSPDVTCRQLTLHLSDQCNLRCKYCWIGKSDAEILPVMTRGIAAAALTMFPEDGRDLRVGFFGGEPLLHFGLLMAITEMAEERAARSKAKALFHVTTNATLVTPLVARFLAEHGFSIIVSCDGPEDLHDAARGEGSYAAMRRGLARLHQAGCGGRVTLRGTWSGMPAEVLARLGHLNALCEKGLAAGVALEPVAGAAYGQTLDAEIRSACNWFGAHARSGGTPRWRYLEKTLGRILWQQFRASECGAGRGYCTVGPTPQQSASLHAAGPTGAIYACHKQQNSRIGQIEASTSSTTSTVVRIDEALRTKWLDNRFCVRRECSLCWARHVCGGACRSESLEFCGGIGRPHAGRCTLMRQLVAEALRLAATLPRETLLKICPSPASGSL